MNMLQTKPISGHDVTNPHVKNVTLSSFMADVIQKSMEVPVIAYFWAPWCSTCKPFGPLLEKLVNAANGKLQLAKINIDECPQIAGQFRIQSVPTVYVMFQGQPTDGFNGALPESELKKFLDRFMQGEEEGIEAVLEQANALLEAGESEAALQVYTAILAELPDTLEAMLGKAKALIALAKLDEAEDFIEKLPAATKSDVKWDSIKASLTLARNKSKAGDPEQLKKQLEKDPKNHQLRYELAESLYAHELQEEAMDELLTIISSDRMWNEEAARKLLVTYFEALGHMHPLTLKGRRRLSSLLFS